MKSIACASLAALLLVSLALPSLTLASADGPSASGSFQFSLDDGQLRNLEFNARVQNNGRTIGEMTFSDQAAVPVPDPDDTTAINSPGAVMTAKFDCLQIEGNRAVMSGVISESNIANALGLRVLLVVEDNGEGVNIPTPDKLTWGVYQSSNTSWTPKDAERDDDNGASLKWIAKDAEREDDPGVPSNQSKEIGCKSFPLSSYSFVDIKHGGGNVQVQP
ncbi:MAG TPA: hypothetical protein VHQ94_09355 [Pyrinomonadaceae bacterium]|jgi:hypothetical protein|nr:hypothetical protein [Pyrinomonadaceae bacterium]